jgi:chemotaxis response regulator CheB
LVILGRFYGWQEKAEEVVARVLIVDDSSFMRKPLVHALEQAGDVVTGQAREGGEGYDLYRKLNPDVVVYGCDHARAGRP